MSAQVSSLHSMEFLYIKWHYTKRHYNDALLNCNFQVCDTDDVEIDVADLTQGNRYTFRVAAVNEMGQGDWLEADGDIIAKDPWGKYCRDVNYLIR